MARQSPAQEDTVERVMHEFKHGELDKPDGKPVKNPKQAIAIALHEAGASNRESPAANRRALARTKGKERHGETARDVKERGGAPGQSADNKTRAELYAEAGKRNIPGRSRMSKDELAEALHA